MTKISKSKFKIQNFCFLVVVFSFSLFLFNFSEAEAAIFYFSPIEKQIGLREATEVSLFIDTEGEFINAAEGAIMFPDELIEISDINDANSVIDFWIQKPFLTGKNKIVFSGITPGGFEGVREPFDPEIKPGRILNLTIRAKKVGGAYLALENAVALLNDGKGTPAEITLLPFSLEVTDYPGVPVEKAAQDVLKPEPFTPEIASDPVIFNGKYFLVFATQDKDSGINYYVVYETRRKVRDEKDIKWSKSESPYELKDQDLKSYVYVKAVDKAGNERVAMLPPQYPVQWYEQWWAWGIIIIIILGLFIGAFVAQKLWRKKLTRI